MQINRIPQYLKDNAIFNVWKYENRNGKPTKPPFNPWTGGYGDSSDPSTFTRFPDALDAFNRGGFEGLGIGIFGDIAAVDIDNCLDAMGLLSKMALDIVDVMDSYTEVSPSGKGLRIFFRAPGFRYDRDRYYIKHPKNGLEVYIAGCTKKYVTITGNVYRDQSISEKPDEIAAVLEAYMVRPKVQERTAQYTPTSAQPGEKTDEQCLEDGLKRDARLIVGRISRHSWLI